MSITAVRLKNFMAFSDTGWIDLKPITLLFGANSSGKSAIIRAIRLLKQSIADPPADDVFAYWDEDGVDVDSFETIAHGLEGLGISKFSFYRPSNCNSRADEKAIGFWFRCAIEGETGNLFLSRFPEVHPSDDFVLGLEFVWDVRRKRTGLESLVIQVTNRAESADSPITIFEAWRNAYEDSSTANWLFGSDVLRDYENGSHDNIWPFVEVGIAPGFLPYIKPIQYPFENQDQNDSDYSFVRRLIEYINRTIVAWLDGVEHSQPLRPAPQRIYYLDAALRRRWHHQGLKGFLRLVEGDLDRQQLEEVGFWLKRLDLGDSIWPESLAKIKLPSSLNQLHLDESERGKHDVFLVDAGFGASQVIPVIIQAILANDGQTVIVEQPELHLHPRLQAEMADLFIAKSKRGVRFLLETHSEHLFLRFRRRIAESTTGRLDARREEKLDKELFEAYFVFREGLESSVTEVSVSAMGELENPPIGFEGFFSYDLREMAAISREQLRILQEKRSQVQNKV